MNFPLLARFLFMLTVGVVVCSFHPPGYSNASWWEIDKSSNFLLDTMRFYDSIMIRKVDLDENLVHTCYEYNVINTITKNKNLVKSGRFCYPSVVITGVRKCSTSAVYGLISEIPGIIQLKSKENCAIINYDSIIDYFDSLPTFVEPGKIIIDGCVDLDSNLLMYKLLRQPNTFFVVATRDYSNWIWSAYNYWCNERYEKSCDKGTHWTVVGTHHRSPETFQDIVKGSINGTHVRSPLRFEKPCEHASTFFRSFTSKLLSVVPESATLVIAAEEMETGLQSVWKKLSKKAGLLINHPNIEEFAQYRYNTQQTPAQAREGYHPELSKVTAKEHQPGIYEISDFKPMFNETRAILDSCWKPDCLWVSNITGYRYATCSADLHQVQSSRWTESTFATTNLSSLAADVSAVITETHGYINKRRKMCAEILSVPLNVNSGTKSSERVIGQEAPTVDYTLVISNDDEARGRTVTFINLLERSTVALDLDDNINPNLCPQIKIISAKISDVLIEKAAGSSTVDTPVFRVATGSRGDACGFTKVAIKRVVVLAEDPLVHIWRLYQQTFPQKFQSMSRFNWTAWEAFALESAGKSEVRQASRDDVLDGVSAMISTGRALIVREGDLFFEGNKTAEQLALLAFLRFDRNVPEDVYKCANAAVFGLMKNMSYSYEKTLKRLDWIYSSDEFVCKVRERLASLSAGRTLGIRKLDTAETCGSGATNPIRLQHMCKIRYSSHEFLAQAEMHAPVGLISQPYPYLITTRKLIESVTGIITGASTTNYSHMRTFAGEFNCGQRLSVVYAHPRDLTVKLGRSSAPVASLNSYGKKKCGKGMVRGLHRFVILVEDPLVAVLRTVMSSLCHVDIYNISDHRDSVPLNVSAIIQFPDSARDAVPTSRTEPTAEDLTAQLTRGQHYNHHHHIGNKQRLTQGIKCFGRLHASAVEKIAANYSIQQLFDTFATREIVRMFKPSEYIVVSYDYLTQKISRVSAVNAILQFLKFPAASHERIKCSFILADAAESHAVSASLQSLRHRPQLLCSLKRIFEKQMPANYLEHVVFHDLKCKNEGGDVEQYRY